MYACGDIGIDPDCPEQCQPLDDGGERLAAGLAGWLPHPGQIAQVRASMRQEKGIEQLASSRVQSSGEMFGDMAFGMEQRLCDHPFDGTDARHNDAPSPTLIQQHPREPGPAGRRQRDRQEPFLQCRSQRPTERRETERVAQRIELFVPGWTARSVLGLSTGAGSRPPIGVQH